MKETCEKKVFSVFSENMKQVPSASVIWIAFSGGLDSSVLLHLAVRYAEQNAREVKAIHVHHGLSDYADNWEQHANDVCIQYGTELIKERITLGDQSDGTEQAARDARYEVFCRYVQKEDYLLQGHHQDDQAETFFMRALRGSGSLGLSGIPHQRQLSATAGHLFRPLLGLTRQQLEQYADAHNISWIEDDSNISEVYERNWWRHQVLPLVRKRFGDGRQTALIRTMQNLSDEHSLLQALVREKTDTVYNSALHPALRKFPSLSIEVLPEEYGHQCIFLRTWLSDYLNVLPESVQLKNIITSVINAAEDAEPYVNLGDFNLMRYRKNLFLVSMKWLSNTSEEYIHWNGQDMNWAGGVLSLKEGKNLSDVIVRRWKEGDRIRPEGRPSRKLKKIWQEYGIPPWLRSHWPVLTDQDDLILAIPGLCLAEGAADKEPGLSGGASWVPGNITVTVTGQSG